MRKLVQGKLTERRGWGVVGIAVALTAALYLARTAGPPDVMDSAQHRTAGYVLDIVINGNWLCQRDVTGAVASKPPLYCWLSALPTLLTGAKHWTITIVSAASVAGLALLVWSVARRRFGTMAAAGAALGLLLAPITIRQMGLSRPDALFALLVACAAFAALRACERGGGWTWFWLAAALGTLTKGPLVIVLASAGLLAMLFEPCERRPMRAIFRAHVAGVAIFIVLAGGWFLWAYLEVGRALVDQMIFNELIGQAVSTEKKGAFGAGLHRAPLYFFSRFFPMSILTCCALWRVWRSPETDAERRRFERFLALWLLVGLAIFAVAAHQRADLIFPLIPPAAILAGREIERLVRGWSARQLAGAAGGAVALALMLTFAAYSGPRSHRPPVELSATMHRIADELRQRCGRDFPLTHVDSPFALQFYLGTMRRTVSYAQAAQLLRECEGSFVVVRDHKRLRKHVGRGAPPTYVVASWPESEKPMLYVVSNHPRLERTSSMSAAVGPIHLQTQGLQPLLRGERQLTFTSHGSATLRNDSSRPRAVRVELRGDHATRVERRVIEPGEAWDLNFDGLDDAIEDAEVGVES